MVFDCILAADLAWGIGKNNGLPWPKLSADMKHFRRVTGIESSAIVMGRKTWESAEIAKRPLPKRLNIVLSGQVGYDVPAGVELATSIDDARAVATSKNIQNLFVIGGSQLYKAAVQHPSLRWIYLTIVNGQFDCDVTIDSLGDFKRIEWAGASNNVENGISFEICKLGR